ncbi:MAG: hypothetical protein GTO45_25760 [Candidatus Aminicenantes bacterium]|nr:hypothetical protein [Candidatus Aminicenantes bacterium]NIM82145.1 hypothetical protein [Candidatus Aminicenantes bacterium]NIN21546.1 hypothetical protein [Candidatus Aminicenantes bacterium]NIN45355.1 hypothetical protein [Candidatus Aminicenantes bacterium]NIN88176.1 hypothetical protein [Candidatus Aminicenantes bacterium]
MASLNDKHFESLKKAFEKDNFIVKNFKEQFPGFKYVTPKGYMEYEGKAGLLAEHKTAKNAITGEPKRVYYVEGTNYQMGFLLGLMAEPQVTRMSTEFVEQVAFAFFSEDEIRKSPFSFLLKPIQELVVRLISEDCRKMRPDIP